ncbi:MAG: phosphoribosyltransferase [Caldilineaceae bacterium]|nr:phosphoribosyltransferase [Caldilineaceae bacterium]MCB9157846.1 phosphoribosyltransferase [Caldilineaceae bacterium]
MKNIYLSWHDTEELISKLIFQLRPPYDAILVITRGGIIPGGMIAEALEMKDVLTAAVLMPEDPSRRTKLSWPRFLQFPPDAVLEERKILIVDNLWFRGRTIMAVKGRVEAAGGIPELAVLHWKKDSSLFEEDTPDYYAEETEDFVHYPWQRIDDSDYRLKAIPEMPLS